ncbi:MAG: hypothetical protein HC903_09870 [Methylacidiphilales bacterium]|nr:hypothetical protein [Candidatus Methylacidiphilales bacterium]NJR15789.1 hypothetical protein [Calothrix sp. CSU_2_0]
MARTEDTALAPTGSGQSRRRQSSSGNTFPGSSLGTALDKSFGLTSVPFNLK